MTDQETIGRAVTSGAAATAGPERTAIFAAVRADRDGPVTGLLLALADAGTVEARVGAIELLGSLAEFGQTWPVVADRTSAYLVDPEPGVRVAAAALFVATHDVETVSARLPGLADPDVRVAGLTALIGRAGAFEDVLTRLLEDGDPAVRVLAALGLLGTEGVPWAWVQALDEAISADLPAAVRRVGLGSRSWGSTWAWRLVRDDHEDECHRIVRQLLAVDDPGVRWVGLDMASAAIRLWRTAPVELLPALAEVAVGADPALRAQTLRVLRLSGDLWQAAGDLWAADAGDVGRALSGEPGASAPVEVDVPELHAVFAARRPAGGRAAVEPWLAEQPIDVTRHRRRVGRALVGLMACGGLTERQGRQAMALFEHESVLKYELAGVVWRQWGVVDAGIADRLVAELSAVAGDQYVGAHVLPVLADMGRHAVGALPRLTALIEDRRRLPVADSSAEAEIRFDETRRAQLVVVRDRIIADIP
ncbi:hypothetical protein [Embleya sp. NPDC005575]|uniref:hypothetical protein n=1 Tax=Embleya sp. NPDC005575 TaxID=3156892 RepID=UPI0033AB97FD